MHYFRSTCLDFFLSREENKSRAQGFPGWWKAGNIGKQIFNTAQYFVTEKVEIGGSKEARDRNRDCWMWKREGWSSLLIPCLFRSAAVGP